MRIRKNRVLKYEHSYEWLYEAAVEQSKLSSYKGLLLIILDLKTKNGDNKVHYENILNRCKELIRRSEDKINCSLLHIIGMEIEAEEEIKIRKGTQHKKRRGRV